jgi:hypothetical protein
MNFKKRNSSSTEYPKLLEYLQAGILVRFNITETISDEDDEMTYYLYDEFWFPETATAQELETFLAGEGHDFNDEYKNGCVVVQPELPNQTWLNAEIAQWLNNRGVATPSSWTKARLLEEVNNFLSNI